MMIGYGFSWKAINRIKADQFNEQTNLIKRLKVIDFGTDKGNEAEMLDRDQCLRVYIQG